MREQVSGKMTKPDVVRLETSVLQFSVLQLIPIFSVVHFMTGIFSVPYISATSKFKHNDSDKLFFCVLDFILSF